MGPNGKNNPDDDNNSNISVVFAEDLDTQLIAATSTKPKKTPEELKAVKLLNLEKARATKAIYKRLDEEAKERGEIPPSVGRKIERDFPIMLDSEKNIRTLNLKEQLWNTNVSLALPQLLYYASELWYQYLHLLGGQPNSGNARVPIVGDDMEVDVTQKADPVQNINIDTTTALSSKTSLQSVLVKVADIDNLELLLEGGTVVSVINLHVVKHLGKEADMSPTNKTLRYGGGEIDIPVGVI